MNWTFSVAACRYDGVRLSTTSYVLEGDAEQVRTISAGDATGLAAMATTTYRRIAVSDAIVEAGRVDGEPYLLVLRHGSVSFDGLDGNGRRPIAIGAPLLLGPSASLAVAEEWSLSPARPGSTRLSLGSAAKSPYPPHRSPLGAAPLHAIAAEPFRWSRPFAALDADRNAVLAVTCPHSVAAPDETTTIESLVPLVANGSAMEWLATLSDGTVARIRASLPLLLSSIAGATSAPVPGLIDDPVAGERYGYAPSLLTTLTLADVMEDAR
jgi:hypothetical protein